ncbi:C4-dicarboxylate transport sensor protein DctB [Vibrio stylophorae]|uniref:histidine kinase n=1 Tax=Vibrio stylophorae TaxID=659351 RepID=A0ABN8DZK1_9VIBR|nr:ATP-binding protein [Vibrio stylophorae]CAH0535805.1 C4-dicarboxylate transport sensor protein DctB [Vibrio stylophorae]
MNRSAIFSALALWFVMCFFVSVVTFQQGRENITQTLDENIVELGEKLTSELNRFQNVPVLLSDDPRVIHALSDPVQAKDLNHHLERWAGQLGADAIYLLDRDGSAIASSNWQQPDSFIGHNFRYRPYYQLALGGQLGRYFALGAVSQKRGYYFSYGVVSQRKIQGVVVVKVDLANAISSWPHFIDNHFVVADEMGVAFYSSYSHFPDFALAPLTPYQIQRLQDTNRYGKHISNTLVQDTYRGIFHQASGSLVNFSEDSLATVMVRHPMTDYGWQLYGFNSLYAAYERVGQAILVANGVYFLLLLAFMSWRQTTVTKRKLSDLNDQLETLVISRTHDLVESNQQLRDTLIQYERSQAELKQTQSELMQAAKLAMLGELSASINHEINQPLAAMRSYAENTEKLIARERYDLAQSNLSEIIKLNTMVAEIIARFKVFAKRTDMPTTVTSVSEAIRAAIAIIRNQLIKQGVTVKVADIDESWMVNADAVQLEQVLINLLHNAIQALQQAASPTITITTERVGHTIEIYVADNGSGLSKEAQQRIFEPFFSTKKTGLGLGLTISRRMIESFHGTLQFQAEYTQGACFVICLPCTNQEDSQ